MKRGTPEHPKIKELARLLAQRWQERFSSTLDKPMAVTMAVGILERLIHFTSRYAPQGDIGKHKDYVIAEAIGWNEDDGEWLGETLVACRFFDHSNEHRLILHGWSEHSDEYADRFLADNGQAYADGSPARSKPRKGSKAESGKLPADNRPHPPADAGDGGRTRAEAGYQNQNQNQNQNQKQKQGDAANASGSSSEKSDHRKAGNNKPAKNDQPVAIPQELQTEKFLHTWGEWLGYRRDEKLTITPRTLLAQLEKLRSLGAGRAIECIQMSIQNGWHGLFPNHAAKGHQQAAVTQQPQATPITLKNKYDV